ncbi:MAG: hypothetical protein E7426_00665 [Ruminococcaceae bacterium]|nr:hypothetical protein [Oscillospiraceae bacterium]
MVTARSLVIRRVSPPALRQAALPQTPRQGERRRPPPGPCGSRQPWRRPCRRHRPSAARLPVPSGGRSQPGWRPARPGGGRRSV